MNKYRLQAELWETQLILYWILGFLLLHTSNGVLHFLGWLAVLWGLITFVCVVKLSRKAFREDPYTL
jgi:uncharacterized membrane protein